MDLLVRYRTSGQSYERSPLFLIMRRGWVCLKLKLLNMIIIISTLQYLQRTTVDVLGNSQLYHSTRTTRTSTRTSNLWPEPLPLEPLDSIACPCLALLGTLNASVSASLTLVWPSKSAAGEYIDCTKCANTFRSDYGQQASWGSS